MIKEPLNVEHAIETRNQLQNEIADLQGKIGLATHKSVKAALMHEREKLIKDLRFVKQWIVDNPTYSPLFVAKAQSALHDLMVAYGQMERELKRLQDENEELKIRVSEIAF